MNRIEIFQASDVDIPRIVELKLMMFDESGHSDLLSSGARDLIENDYHMLYKSGFAKHFVAKDGETIVATAGAFIKSEFPFRYFKNSQYGFLGDVYTSPNYRKRGYAQSLSVSAIDWLKSQNISMIRLLASDAGRPIYEKPGFCSSDEMVFIVEDTF